MDVPTEGILEVSSGREKWWRAASATPLRRGLAGCGKTIVARENFDGPHVWDKPCLCLSGPSGISGLSGWSHTAKQTNQINKRDQLVLAFHAPLSALLRWAMMSLASARGSVVKGAAC